MSLKAKLEAVIYAAEEPVTLAQLAALFAEDAFAWKAERDAENAPPAPAAGIDPDAPDAVEAEVELTGLLPELSTESPSELSSELPTEPPTEGREEIHGQRDWRFGG